VGHFLLRMMQDLLAQDFRGQETLGLIGQVIVGVLRRTDGRR